MSTHNVFAAPAPSAVTISSPGATIKPNVTWTFAGTVTPPSVNVVLLVYNKDTHSFFQAVTVRADANGLWTYQYGGLPLGNYLIKAIYEDPNDPATLTNPLTVTASVAAICSTPELETAEA